MEPTNTPNVASSTKVRCAECGNAFSKGELLTFGQHHICATCKPIFQQKLSEGSFGPVNLQYAGVGRRFVALVIDGFLTYLVLGVVTFAIATVANMSFLVAMSSTPMSLFSTIFGIVYTVFMIGKYGATFGKMAMGIKVVRADASAVGFPLALGRYFAQFLNVFTFFIGYLMAVWDNEKRGLHDRVCGTRVVHT